MSLSQALSELKQGKWINLSHGVTPDIPHFPFFNPLQVETLTTVENDGFYTQEITIGTQYGTHIDAPFHFVPGRETLQDIPQKDKILDLVVIHLEEEVAKNSDYELTVADILKHEEVYGKIPADSFVAFSSGWSQYFNDAEKFYNRDEEGVEHTPGWSLEALKFLHEKRQVKAIGHETLNTDSGVAAAKNDGSLIGEYYWLDQNKYQIEVLNHLNNVPAVGSLIVIGFPNIVGASGFNADVIAITNN